MRHKNPWLDRLRSLFDLNELLCRMLQKLQSSEDCTPTERENAAKLESELVSVQGSLIEGRGLFRSFMEHETAPDSDIARACGSSTFVAAASNILKWAVLYKVFWLVRQTCFAVNATQAKLWQYEVLGNSARIVISNKMLQYCKYHVHTSKEGVAHKINESMPCQNLCLILALCNLVGCSWDTPDLLMYAGLSWPQCWSESKWQQMRSMTDSLWLVSWPLASSYSRLPVRNFHGIENCWSNCLISINRFRSCFSVEVLPSLTSHSVDCLSDYSRTEYQLWLTLSINSHMWRSFTWLGPVFVPAKTTRMICFVPDDKSTSYCSFDFIVSLTRLHLLEDFFIITV